MAAHRLCSEGENCPAFTIPIICLPATINNNLPGAEFSIGADTALNNIVEAIDKIKHSAVAAGRCFVVEVMGRYCGYRALLSGLASGAERVYTHEEGVTLRALQDDLARMSAEFQHGKRLSLIIRNEEANPVYTTSFMSALFEVEGGELFSVRQAILGHLQQGGDPTPFDRIQATRLAKRCVEFLIGEAGAARPRGMFIGLQGGHVQLFSLEDFPRMTDATFQRPREQWWMELRAIADELARPAPSGPLA
ncbi:hypothetical protein SE17_30525 [Kouleothrix aurantiaca]|uniref:6-phosphofructokinase n=1 Tax=Kouleothrix aurantiaca TaxID=186479 RepID=A0A0P9CW12_9CHLR|nr:hypothetical protein SE17_30525 [Kouleothrix aurantiaca]